MSQDMKTFRARAIRAVATLALATGVALALAPTAMAEEGGDPYHRISPFERLKQEQTEAAEAKVEIVPAAAPERRKSWHDKTPEEWRAYHEAEERLRIENGGR
jgi:hypothetical protein